MPGFISQVAAQSALQVVLTISVGRLRQLIQLAGTFGLYLERQSGIGLP